MRLFLPPPPRPPHLSTLVENISAVNDEQQPPKMQGFNMGRYRPPATLDASLSNSAPSRTSAAKKTSKPQQPQTIRFEMPFAIWCTTCQPEAIIGQGVRFNAHKLPAGKYLSTPIFLFRMRHPACGGAIEIKTDPRNTTYIVESGARKRDYGGDDEAAAGAGATTAALLTQEERDKLRGDAFGRLERTIADRKIHDAAAERVDELRAASDASWRDDYSANQRLRRAFRVGRHEREAERKRVGALQDRMSLSVDILSETDEDALRASVVDFQATEKQAALATPLFGDKKADAGAGAGPKAGPAWFGATVLDNTRAAQDPFLVKTAKKDGGTGRMPGLKRKRDDQDGERGHTGPKAVITEDQPSSKALVDYGSGSDSD